MWEFLIVIILGTSTWVAYDSHMYQVAIDKKSYAVNNGAGAWFFSCILLWPVTFPYYLVRRSSALKAREAEAAKNRKPLLDIDLINLKKLADRGIISREDYEKKKKKLLGID